MTHQLSLELEPGLPRLPRSIRPMLARPAAAPFDSPDHLFEPSWGGERVLAFIEPRSEGGLERDPVPIGGAPTAADDGFAPGPGPATHSLRLLDAAGRDLAPLLPELAGLPERTAARAAVFDGEIIVVDGHGRSDPAALARRLAGQAGPRVAYLVFDLLYLDGRPLLGEPLERRREALGRALVPGADVVAVPAIRGEGLALHAAVVAQGVAGVMARQRRGPYLPGVRSHLWRWVPAAGPDAGSGAADAAPAPEAGEASSGPVLAVISRLPLEE